MPTSTYLPTFEKIKEWYSSYPESKIKETFERYKSRIGFNMTNTDLGTTQLVINRTKGDNCGMCDRKIASGMIAVGKARWCRLCPTCAKTYVSSFIDKLEEYRNTIKDRLEEVDKIDLEKWEEDNKNKLMLEKLKE